MKKHILLSVLLCACVLAPTAGAGESFPDIVLDIRVDGHSVAALEDGSFFLAGDKGDRARTEDQPACAVYVKPDGTLKWTVLEEYNGEGSNYFSGVSRGVDSFFVNNVHVTADVEGEPVYRAIVTEIDRAGVVLTRQPFEGASWLLPAKEGYIIRQPGKEIASGASGIRVYCPIMTRYSQDRAIRWRTEYDIPFVPIRLLPVSDGYYACGSMVGFNDDAHYEDKVYTGALVKLGNQGDVLWAVQAQNACDQYIDGAVLAGGNIVAIGNGTMDGAVQTPTATCYTPDGAVAWERTYAEYAVDRFYAMIELDEAGFLTAGGSQDSFHKIIFMTHDSQGNVVRQWASELGDLNLLPTDVSLHRTDMGCFAVVSADTLNVHGTVSLQARTVIRRVDLE